ncbi:MAG: hypothetical protein QM723_04235 [Myxococcaceae bacterium]
MAESTHAPAEQLKRLARMSLLADSTEKALGLFLKTSRLDVKRMFEVFGTR